MNDPEVLQEQETEQDYDRAELENRIDLLWRDALRSSSN